MTADGFGPDRSRKAYRGMDFTAIETICESTILTGSVTTVSIRINDVTVEDFHQGFGTTSDNDFQEISFD